MPEHMRPIGVTLDPAPGLLCQYPGCPHAAQWTFRVEFKGTAPQDIQWDGCDAHARLWNTCVEPYGTLTPIHALELVP